MGFRNKKIRPIIITSLIVLIFIIFIIRLVQIQIIDSKKYEENAQNRVYRSIPQKAPRGEILDRYGRPLVTNKMGFSVRFDKSLMDTDEINNIILDTIKIFEKTGDKYIDTLPVSKPVTPENAEDGYYKYTYANQDDPTFAQMVKYKNQKKLKDDATAEGVMDYIIKKYDITDEKYTKQEQRLIAGVRYEMDIRGFSKLTPYTFAADISQKTVTRIREMSLDLPGTDIMVEPIRVYTDPTIAPHLLGQTGIIYKEEYKELSEKGYALDDIVGKDGIEKAMEEYLRGKDGVKAYERNQNGEIIGAVNNIDPVPGNNIITTINIDLQRVAQESLERTIKEVAKKGRRTGKGADANAGSVVVLDVNTGEVLAMASYPAYNLETYSTDYAALLKNPDKPLLNRAIQGVYAPGSTFKMASAIAGLENEAITPYTKITDRGIYKKYEGYQPKCWIYTNTGSTHGTVDVGGALKFSCNYFFYVMADKLGIEKLNDTCKRLGLGDYTGIEIAGEKKGILAGVEERSAKGEKWYPGDTLQAAIGQSDNLFTPIQLASYVATVVNQGTRYETHLVKEIRSAKEGIMAKNITPKVRGKVNIDDEAYGAVMRGMRSVTTDNGTASNVFGNYPIAVGGKTGTAQIAKGTSNGSFVAFAPYENPQISVALIVEHAGSGNSIAPVARDIFTKYFESSEFTSSLDYDITIK